VAPPGETQANKIHSVLQSERVDINSPHMATQFNRSNNKYNWFKILYENMMITK